MCHRGWLLVGLSGVLVLAVWSVHSLVAVEAAGLTQGEEPVEHVVQAGETLFRIAQQYDTTVEAIAKANGITDVDVIAVGQKLIIPVLAGTSSTGEGGGVRETSDLLTTYIIVPGDTLDVVAHRFDTKETSIAELNGVANPTGLPAGGQLRVPGAYAGRLHQVGERETALSLALRYDMLVWEFLALNDLSSPGALIPGQRVLVPSETITAALPSPFVALEIGPVPILQGRTVRVKADLVSGAEVRGVFDDEVLNFAVEGNTHYALFGVHALAEPGVYSLALLATDTAAHEAYLQRSVEVLDGGYDVEEISLASDLLDNEALAAERARVAEIRPVFNPERYWDGLFTQPITTEVTSYFGTRRLYKYPSTQFYGYHEGTDFDGEVGSPVHAPAAGVVVLAEQLYLRGNALVIDHGWGIYTGYWHLSQIDVKVGQRIEPGEQIALVGSTGRSTGAHLHWDVWVNGTNVDALQWTQQVFP